MAIVAGGIVPLTPVGGVVTNNPSMAEANARLEQQRRVEQEKFANRQKAVDNMIEKYAQLNNPKWTVPFK